MKTVLKWLLAAAVVAGLAVAFATWPLIDDVETGKTPEYPDLRVKEYAASPERVAKAVEARAREAPALGDRGQRARPGRTLGWRPSIPRCSGWKDDVSVRIWREGERDEGQRALQVADGKGRSAARTRATSASSWPPSTASFPEPGPV